MSAVHTDSERAIESTPVRRRGCSPAVVAPLVREAPPARSPTRPTQSTFFAISRAATAEERGRRVNRKSPAFENRTEARAMTAAMRARESRKRIAARSAHVSASRSNVASRDECAGDDERNEKREVNGQ